MLEGTQTTAQGSVTDLALIARRLARLEVAMEEQRNEWQALMKRLDPLLAMAETMTRWRNPLRRS